MLIKYEFLKILRKKSTLIVMAASLILTGFLFGLPIMQFQTYNQDGVIKGADGIAYEKGQYADLSVPLSEEYVAETIREVQGLFENPDNIGYDGNEQFLIGDAYWNGVAPREKLLNLIANTYSKPNEILGYNNLPDLDIKDGAFFYQTMEGKIQTLLNNPSRKLSDEQKAQVTDKLIRTTNYVEFEMHYSVDESLIGGMVIRIGDRVADSSIRTKLSHLEQQLLKIQLQN